MVEVIELEAGVQRPVLPLRLAGGASEQTLVGCDDQAIGKLQAVIEVDFDPGLEFFAGGQLWLNFGRPAAGEGRLVAGGDLCVGGHFISISQGVICGSNAAVLWRLTHVKATLS